MFECGFRAGLQFQMKSSKNEILTGLLRYRYGCVTKQYDNSMTLVRQVYLAGIENFTVLRVRRNRGSNGVFDLVKTSAIFATFPHIHLKLKRLLA